MTVNLDPAFDRLQGLLNAVVAALPNLLVAVIVFALFVLLARGLRTLVRRVWSSRGQGENLALAFGRLSAGVVLFLGLLVALSIVFPSISAADLLGLLGVGGVAIGFAFRDILQNLLAGILLLLTRPFRIGDQIVAGDSEGTVEDIQIRATLLRTYDNRQVVIPNADLFTNKVTVNTAYDVRRLQYDVGIGVGDDIETARRLMLEAVRSVDGVRSDPAPDVLVVDLAESSVNLRVRWWIDPPRRRDALDTQDRVLQAVKETLLAHGIDLPYPTRQILFHDQTEESDGDRARQREGWPSGSGAGSTLPAPRWRVLRKAEDA